MDFLVQQSKRPYTTSLPSSFTAEGLFLSSNPDNSLEIGLISSNSKPSRQELTKAWRDRRGGRATPVLLIAVYGEFSSLCGPSGDNPAIMEDIDIGRAERLAAESLAQPDRLSAQRFLHDALPTLETKLPGITNEGMLALHNLTTTAKGRSDWSSAGANAQKAVQQSGQDLLQALGYSVEKLDNLTKVLRSADKRAALAVLLDESESIEGGSQRFNTMSPISYAMSKADEENLSWIIIVKGNRIRLYSTEVGKGVGRRGRTETYIECQPSLLADEDLGYLWMLFSAQALGDDGSLAALLSSSERFAGDLAERLRDRIYEEVVPHLAKGIVEVRDLATPSREELDLTYQMALTILFRLLFIAYAEDRDLLPYRQNEAYRKRSLTEKAKELAKAVAEGTDIGSGHHHWQECEALFSAVNIGNSEWSVPTYGGGLFSQDPQISPAGDALKGLSVSNEYFEKALRALLVTDAEGEPGAVDFRSLGVREFGTIYEGLLEAELSAAESDLMLDKKATYVPVAEGKEADVKSGEVYLHNKSGARKSSGSYYTKSFAVEYLLDGTLEPALDDHLAKLDAMGSDVDAAEKFFDFRVADIAMGSGHFLVAAVDRIEARMANYLKKRQEEKRPLTLVQQDLNDLRNAAQKELGEIQDDFDIEDGQLLRRQIARRCIYGVDLNPLAVQLARLSIWIHTFVPGLPLSLLDHNLVHGNALVGVGTVDEIRDKFDQMGGTLFQVDADNLLGQAAKPLRRLANLKDATPADIEAGRRAMQEARLATLETEALCDLITAQPISEDKRVKGFAFQNWEEEKGKIHASRELGQARKDLQGLHAFHFPIQFPEVFLGKNPGFNVILGNPPWDKVRFEKENFYIRFIPGLNALRSEDRKIKISNFVRAYPEALQQEHRFKEFAELNQAYFSKSKTSFSLQGSGHLELSKLFSERFIRLSSASGYLGYVCPRPSLVLAGWQDLRRKWVDSGVCSVVQLQNKGQWVFDDLHAQISTALIVRHNVEFEGKWRLFAGARSLDEFNSNRQKQPFELLAKELREKISPTDQIPMLLTQSDFEIAAHLSSFPRLKSEESGNFYSIPFASLDVGKDKALFEIDDANNLSVLRTRDISHFSHTSDVHAKRVSRSKYIEFLESRLQNSRNPNLQKLAGTRYSDIHKVVYRYPSTALNTRTLIATILPDNCVPAVGYVHSLIMPRASLQEKMAMIALLNSALFDWYVRLIADRHVTAQILQSLPLSPNVPKIAEELAACAASLIENENSSEAFIQYEIELNRLVFEAYGISKKHAAGVFSTFSSKAYTDDFRGSVVGKLKND